MFTEWFYSFRLWWLMNVEQPFVCRFGEVRDCGCVFYRKKHRFVCINHFMQMIDRGKSA